MTFLNDDWTTDIQLGYVEFAHNAREMILKADPPFSLTIGGRWGSGKTSMLRTLMASLGGKLEGDNFPSLDPRLRPKPQDNSLKSVKTVWFNPWQYQNEPNPLVPLLREIRDQIRTSFLGVNIGGNFKVEAKNKIMAVLDTGLRTIATLTDAAVSFPGSRATPFSQAFSHLDNAHERMQRETFSGKVEAQRFHVEFDKAIAQVVCPSDKDGDKARLVVFIDDLDRCSDLTVYSLLESIKLYLSSKHCVFVFGMDRTHVETAVGRVGKYSQPEAAQYVEKLFQAKLLLPIPSQDNLLPFIQGLLTKLDFSPSTTMAKTVAGLLPGNPRNIKNFLNGLAFLEPFYHEKELNEEGRLLIHWLRSFCPDLYELLHQRPEEVLADLLQYCRNELHPKNERMTYIHYLLETPLLISSRDTEDLPDKFKPIAEERFRLMRAGAWKAGAEYKFRERFFAIFSDTASNPITDYLI